MIKKCEDTWWNICVYFSLYVCRTQEMSPACCHEVPRHEGRQNRWGNGMNLSDTLQVEKSRKVAKLPFWINPVDWFVIAWFSLIDFWCWFTSEPFSLLFFSWVVPDSVSMSRTDLPCIITNYRRSVITADLCCTASLNKAYSVMVGPSQYFLLRLLKLIWTKFAGVFNL